MFVADPLFGPITTPSRLDQILRTPEVQRLREIRLINTTTPSLSGLSDTRRFTHTVGVLHLALGVAKRLHARWPAKQLETLLLAAILHDVGTPAYGHLFEYLLKVQFGFAHEAMLKSIIAGDYHRTGLFHQIYFGAPLRLRECIERLDVDPDEVVSFVLGQSPLGRLVAGTLDLDNVDNVHRMAAGLGLPYDRAGIDNLARAIDVHPETGTLTLPHAALPLVEHWVKLRRKCYEVLAFDEQALASQAMLTECLTVALQSGLLTEAEWFLTDEQLLRRLLDLDVEAPRPMRETVLRFATGDYFSTIFIGWYRDLATSVDLRHTDHRAVLRNRLEEALGIPVFPYVFHDRGTFVKQLKLNTVGTDGALSPATVGENSQSTIVGLFTSRRIDRPARSVVTGAKEVLAEFGLTSDALHPLPDKRDVYEIPGALKLI
ncbi:HD domain-containing protein [Phytohabitans aurantiacus]|uniref:HD domain-containing protein n=1 Tax=Phytohabitans aurantiacus TaxID=3016789 RepID=A0ABQ5QMH2_9ACTN|nr:HD domain-containing protein [Phytohabitans aurantiacus]GLH95598.1 hypothetical protein Pa4123_08700 [Phytohabitans aurantiacus]